ncbi:hypothetical protein I203_107675 [Kwoniella mangroviensis CBS 8507]|uniref:hypothetical protein n=1 Tax=Kwoniella mangroviensis CBS 8507 TaxID=1296122 RepID=UPI00080D6004|nr:uncharacterized protein I203_02423 [Kwoniella mangroviensis CBS 8507]OCF69027.1 hypothetical protein I203_02423 [Kwoniella mangroviensis CBS 8507]
MTGEVSLAKINLNPPSKRPHSPSIPNAHQSDNPHKRHSDAECPQGKARRIGSGPGSDQTLNPTKNKIPTINELSRYLNEAQAELKLTRTKKEKESRLMRLTENYQVMKIHLIKEKINNTTLIKEKEVLEKDNERLRMELKEVRDTAKKIDPEVNERKGEDRDETIRKLEEQLAEEKLWNVNHRIVLHSRFEKINSLGHRLRSQDEDVAKLKNTIQEKEKVEGVLRERIKIFQDKLPEIRKRVSSE